MQPLRAPRRHTIHPNITPQTASVRWIFPLLQPPNSADPPDLDCTPSVHPSSKIKSPTTSCAVQYASRPEKMTKFLPCRRRRPATETSSGRDRSQASELRLPPRPRSTAKTLISSSSSFLHQKHQPKTILSFSSSRWIAQRGEERSPTAPPPPPGCSASLHLSDNLRRCLDEAIPFLEPPVDLASASGPRSGPLPPPTTAECLWPPASPSGDLSPSPFLSLVAFLRRRGDRNGRGSTDPSPFSFDPNPNGF